MLSKVMRRTRTQLGILAAVVLSVAGCDPDAPVAATRTDGQPTLVPGLCPGEAVESVYVTAGTEDEDEVLWRIDASEPVRYEMFVIGEVPAGFEESVPPADALYDGEHTAFVVTDSGIQLVGIFDVATLQEGDVRLDTEVVDLDSVDDDRDCR